MPVAQLAEQRPFKSRVQGSSPCGHTAPPARRLGPCSPIGRGRRLKIVAGAGSNPAKGTQTGHPDGGGKFRLQDSNLDRAAPKADVLPLHQGGPRHAQALFWQVWAGSQAGEGSPLITDRCAGSSPARPTNPAPCPRACGFAGMAQLGAHRTCNAGVAGSSPATGPTLMQTHRHGRTHGCGVRVRGRCPARGCVHRRVVRVRRRGVRGGRGRCRGRYRQRREGRVPGRCG